MINKCICIQLLQGDEAAYRMTIPRLRVRREWYVGLSADPIDHDHPDVGAGDDTGEFATQQRRRRNLMQTQPGGADGVEEAGHLTQEAADSFNELFGEDEPDYQGQDYGQDVDEEVNGDGQEDLDHVLPGHDVNNVRKGRREKRERPSRRNRQGDLGAAEVQVDEEEEKEVAEYTDYGDYALDYNNQGGEDEEEQRDEDRETPDQLDDFDYHMWDYHTRDESKDTFVENQAPYVSPYAYVDAHVLATPTIADIDDDGREELVVAVSYFYDPSEYESGSPRSMWLGEGIEISKYVASGVVVFDLHTRATKWSQHLDLSTGDTRYRADAYSSPTVADVNGDGKLEVIVGTSMVG